MISSTKTGFPPDDVLNKALVFDEMRVAQSLAHTNLLILLVVQVRALLS